MKDGIQYVVIDISETVKEHDTFIENLLATHALLSQVVILFHIVLAFDNMQFLSY